MTFNPPISKRKSGANDEKASSPVINQQKKLSQLPPSPTHYINLGSGIKKLMISI